MIFVNLKKMVILFIFEIIVVGGDDLKCVKLQIVPDVFHTRRQNATVLNSEQVI